MDYNNTMSIKSITEAHAEIYRLRRALSADIKKTYPEGTLLKFTRYGNTYEGYVAHTSGERIYLCDSEGWHHDFSPAENIPTVLHPPEDTHINY